MVSFTAAKTLATNHVISQVEYVEAILKEIQEKGVGDILMKIYKDSKNLYKMVLTFAMVEDCKLRLVLTLLKESVKNREKNGLVAR